MAIANMCRHNDANKFCQDNNPSTEEINIFRLWECPECHRWISLLGLTNKSPQYKEIKSIVGFDNAYKHIKWHY